MSEAGGSNIEIAQHLSERKEAAHSLGHEILEIAEAVVLAVVAITTAWSGYQSALWAGHQAELYGQASKLRVEAEGVATYANQERLYAASTVVEWLKAEAHSDQKLADIFERRFLPEFRPTFEAWKETDPLNNPNAPAGPQLMEGYRSSKTEEAAKLNDQATEVFEQGTRDRQYSDDYVRVYVSEGALARLAIRVPWTWVLRQNSHRAAELPNVLVWSTMSGKRPKRTVLLSVHEWVKWTLPQVWI
jgi:hypothetical protein